VPAANAQPRSEMAVPVGEELGNFTQLHLQARV